MMCSYRLQKIILSFMSHNYGVFLFSINFPIGQKQGSLNIVKSSLKILIAFFNIWMNFFNVYLF